ncbi:hypothetical protein Lmac_0955 [Legionella maceachernii]|uniref:Uncharacterized protein n=1 Tax=Legionella maceachernii TaxID=466 RepID=A0A0W0W8V6_9GAMM|nr:hypothetical protein Lmac_0955 [Legionella maceachernii]SJZ70974.1 hypothetical protein SAMN02745128_00866 [Legionella maceachernii]SUP02323.1 Uncharacterised protein [Legionella maceachernii]
MSSRAKRGTSRLLALIERKEILRYAQDDRKEAQLRMKGDPSLRSGRQEGSLEQITYGLTTTNNTIPINSTVGSSLNIR